MFNVIKSGLLLLTILALSSCSMIYDKQVQWRTVKPENFPVLHAIGYAPISLQKSENKTQQMLMAIQASKLAAYSELAEQVYGQQISHSTKLGDLILQDQTITASVTGLIRGARVIKSYPIGDDTYATELSLDMKDVYDILEASSPRTEIQGTTYY